VLETESRHVPIGRVLRLHARDGLVDPVRMRVSLADHFPVRRFGASFYVRPRDRFALGAKDASPSNPIDAL